MAALVQTIPQQTTVTMLQARPSSPGGYSNGFPSNSSPRRYHQQSNSAPYRGIYNNPTVPPYAFSSTPPLNRPQPTPHATAETRSVSAPILPQISFLPSTQSPQTQQKPQPQSMSKSTLPPTPFQPLSGTTKSTDSEVLFPDFSSWPQPKDTVPKPVVMQPVKTTQPRKPIPDRYRRPVGRVDNPEQTYTRFQHHAPAASTSAIPQGTIYQNYAHSSSSPALASHDRYKGVPYQPDRTTSSSADDMTLSLAANKQIRRRSIGGLETAGLNHSNDSQEHVSPHPNTFLPPQRRTDPQTRQTAVQLQQPLPHQHNNNSEIKPSHPSGHSPRTSSVSRSVSCCSSKLTSLQARNDRPSSPGAQTRPPQVASMSRPDVKVINIPPKPVEASKRNPSPLSKPFDINEQSRASTEPKQPSKLAEEVRPATAAEQLVAVSQKEAKRSKSKLRRAFSFGSATELRKATAQNNLERAAAPIQTPSKRNSKYEDEMPPEQARIAEKQEAAGLGNSIYSGQGNFFTGSTDNLSISSTASSASLMLRKMGKGVKRSTKSLVGLFRPKSVIGVPAADGPLVQPQVSMVNVEAERERVNVNPNPHDQPGGGTGFPKLERNSVDAKYSTDSGTASSSRRSIVGGEKERAEVLAAVKKGILKRTDSGQSSPISRPVDSRSSDFNLPNVPHVNDSPRSSAPSTPADDHPPRSGHRRTDSIQIEGVDHDDYFASMSRFASTDSNNGPLTPRAALARNISFSPRIQFHDTWPSGEYDRRGDVATCNRLTPMLAQQIKEELNTFKMVSLR